MFVQRGDTLSGIASRFPGVYSQSQIQNKVREILAINPHIKNPNRIYPGALLNLGSNRGVGSVPYESDMLEMQRILGEDPVLTDRLLDNWETVDTLTEIGAPAVLNPLKPAYKFGKAALTTAKEAAKGRFKNLLDVSPHAWREVEGSLVRGVRDQVRYLRSTDGTLGLIPKGTRAFSNGSKVFVVNPAQGSGFREFSAKVAAGKSFSKKILDPAKKAARVIDLGVSGYNIYQDWGTSQQNRTIVKEGLKTATSLALGTSKIAASTGVCTLLTVSTGVGGVVCFVTVYLVFSYAESEIVDLAGDKLYEGGNHLYYKVYESNSPQVILP